VTSRNVTVFGSAFAKEDSEKYTTAYELGKLLAQSGYVLCNGGYGGIMEASARGVKEAGGKTIGVVTEVFGAEANKYIDQTIVTKTHVERLLKLIGLGDAYVVLPGGTGTLVELATVWEYMNKGMLAEKPLVVVGEFWRSVVETITVETKREGKRASTYVTMVDSPHQCMDILRKRLTP
jgi:uncharacterized protein (TIGR00725 family)